LGADDVDGSIARVADYAVLAFQRVTRGDHSS
jgi:hypothetical protein